MAEMAPLPSQAQPQAAGGAKPAAPEALVVELCECCAAPGGCGRCCCVCMDWTWGCGFTGGELGDLTGDGYWKNCLLQGPVSWLLPCILRPWVLCCLTPRLFGVLGANEEECCVSCLRAFFCTPCRTCQFLNEFDRRREMGIPVQRGVRFQAVASTAYALPQP
jgi:hypothetical protein